MQRVAPILTLYGIAVNTALPLLVVCSAFFETRLFSRLVQEYFSDEEFRRLQLEVVKIPEAGPVIPGSRGVRKLRWAAGGRGKRGGYRVVYFVRRPKL
jgi:hypothetical protein